MRTVERRRPALGECRWSAIELPEERLLSSCCRPAFIVAAAWRETDAERGDPGGEWPGMPLSWEPRPDDILREWKGAAVASWPSSGAMMIERDGGGSTFVDVDGVSVVVVWVLTGCTPPGSFTNSFQVWKARPRTELGKEGDWEGVEGISSCIFVPEARKAAWGLRE
jgi:hypothetical protein